MTTPPEPRPALIRPSVAVSMGAATLLAAVLIGVVLTVRFRELRAELIHPTDRALVETVIESLREREVGLTAEARQAMIELLARQDQALLGAAEEADEAVVYVSMLLVLTIVAAGLVIVPMAWLYIRSKPGGVIEVKG